MSVNTPTFEASGFCQRTPFKAGLSVLLSLCFLSSWPVAKVNASERARLLKAMPVAGSDIKTFPYSDSFAIPIGNDAELDQHIERNLRPQPSTETKPIIATVGSSTYRIPRNYIISFDILTIKVTLPDYKIPAFQPLTENIRECFGSIIQGEKAGCASIEVNIDLPFISHKQLLARYMPMVRNKEPRKEAFGYNVYDIGPESARTEVYTKTHNDDFVLFTCSFFDSDKTLGVCDDRFALNDGNSAHLFFRQNQIANIPGIETGIRNLMESFRGSGSRR